MGNNYGQISLLLDSKGYEISGEISLDSLPEIERQLAKLSEPTEWQVECQAVSYANSALIALLLKLKQLSTNANKSLRVQNLPDGIRSAVLIYGLESILLE